MFSLDMTKNIFRGLLWNNPHLQINTATRLNKNMTGFDSESWDLKSEERRESSESSSIPSTPNTADMNKNLEWNESQNARTQQRMRQRKEFGLT